MEAQSHLLGSADIPLAMDAAEEEQLTYLFSANYTVKLNMSKNYLLLSLKFTYASSSSSSSSTMHACIVSSET